MVRKVRILVILISVYNNGYGRDCFKGGGGFFGGVWLEIGVFGGKMRIFIEKWGFRGVLVKKSGKSRKAPGI